MENVQISVGWVCIWFGCNGAEVKLTRSSQVVQGEETALSGDVARQFWSNRYREALPLAARAVDVLENSMGEDNGNVATALVLQVQNFQNSLYVLAAIVTITSFPCVISDACLTSLPHTSIL